MNTANKTICAVTNNSLHPVIGAVGGILPVMVFIRHRTSLNNVVDLDVHPRVASVRSQRSLRTSSALRAFGFERAFPLISQ
eukprot:1350843-Pyramimonas_sp.AAC.1